MSDELLQQELLNVLGEYGSASADGASQPERLHRWSKVLAAIKDHTRANVEAATAKLETELSSARFSAQYFATQTEQLRAEVERLDQLTTAISRDCNECANARNAAEARAESLAEAVRGAREYVAAALSEERIKFAGHEGCSEIAIIASTLHDIDAALAQEPGGVQDRERGEA